MSYSAIDPEKEPAAKMPDLDGSTASVDMIPAVDGQPEKGLESVIW